MVCELCDGTHWVEAEPVVVLSARDSSETLHSYSTVTMCRCHPLFEPEPCEPLTLDDDRDEPWWQR